ncbi:hypothetical protein B0H11DRAFT_1922667 [Mycena galericulata]|nr:hypothetical protein B0H11DRAFT_1922667 [Mycena galericulata]
MFGFYIHVIRKRGMFNNRFLTIATIFLFILCTAHCALIFAESIFLYALSDTYLKNAALDLESFPMENNIYVAVNRAENAVYITSKYFAAMQSGIFDGLSLFFRQSLLSLLQSDGYNYEFGLPDASNTPFALLFNISITMSVFTTFILMGLSAGRIWWLARTSQKVMGRRVTSTYCTVCAMILESGTLYCVGAIPFIGVGFASYFGLVATDITTSGAILGQLVGIAPTIIAVRVGLGRSFENVDSFITASHILPHKRTPRTPFEIRSAGPQVLPIEPQVLYLRPESGDVCEKEEVV